MTVRTSMVPGHAVSALDGRVSGRLRPRPFAVGCVLITLVLVVGVWTLMTGDYPATVLDVLRTVFGEGPRGLELIVNRFRMPRLLNGIGVGAALGAAGAIFQSVSRNPLGSPDVIGFTTGSATGALLVLLVWPDAGIGVATGAVLGGVLSALVVYLLAYRRGVQGNRLILVGIGIGAILSSANAFLLSRAALEEAQNAQLWLVGSLNGRGWDQVGPLWTALVVLLPAALVLARRMALMEMGDEAAIALGVPAERIRIALVACGIGLTAVATATAGPIVFVALAAPQIARRLARCGTPPLLLAALTGALVLTAADLAGQRLFAPTQLPVGLSTGALGGLYLSWLLGREWRKGG